MKYYFLMLLKTNCIYTIQTEKMNIYWFLFLVIGIVAFTSGFIWILFALNRVGKEEIDYLNEAKEDVEHIFNDDFREELRNRGRLHFEKIITENAMFLQQDLRLTTSQIHDFMREEISRVLKQEFSKYEESITSAKDQAIQSIQKTQVAIEEQRKVLEKQLQDQFESEKQQLLTKFQDNMGEIVNHYIMEAIGSEVDLSNQLDYIFNHLEENKKAIIEDIKSGT